MYQVVAFSPQDKEGMYRFAGFLMVKVPPSDINPNADEDDLRCQGIVELGDGNYTVSQFDPIEVPPIVGQFAREKPRNSRAIIAVLSLN
jgi:hypothetical protein